MRITRIGYALGVAASVAMFAGCSSNGSSLGPIAQAPGQTQSIVRNHPVTMLPGAVLRQITPGTPYKGKNWAKPDTHTSHLIYGCEFFGGVCNWYHRGVNTLAGQIAASYPNDLCDDKSNNVYIPDGGTKHIFVYAKGSTTLIRDMDNTSQGQPSACAVAANGTVYVGNIASDTVSVYKPNANTPSSVLTVNAVTGGAGYVIGVAIDENKTLAVSWVNFNTGHSGVDEFPNASGGGSTVVDLGLTFGGGVNFDGAENLVVNDQNAGTTNVYNGSTFAECNSFGTGSGDSVNTALDKKNNLVAQGDALNGAIYEQTFGDCSGGGSLVFTYTDGFSPSGSLSGEIYDPGEQH
jgi:hypothetical protein